MEFFTSRVICPFSGPVSSSVLFLILFTVLIGCEKDSRLPFSDKPEIELVSVSHDTIVEYEDRLVIRIKYTDGNGDLGFEDPELYALFVRDLRLADFDDFYIGPLAPPGSNIAITGELDIEFPSLFVFGNRPNETTLFEVKMVDRAGNESNLLMTSPVVIRKP